MSYILVYSTFSSEKKAGDICKQLVERSLVACANIFPKHKSIYKWDGEIVEESEFLAIMKTKESQFGSVKDEICKLHSYDTPCVLKLDIAGGNEDFLEWISSSVK